MAPYYKSTVLLAFTLGILATLGFKDLYPELESRYRQWRRGRRLSFSSEQQHVYMRDDEGPQPHEDDPAKLAEAVDPEDLPLPLKRDVKEGIEGTIGLTPLIRIKSLSDALDVDILAKCEFLNGAGGSPKDRVALAIISDAEREGLLRPHTGDTIYEGSVGSTGISLATIARARGYMAHVCMPSDQSIEKRSLLGKLGAKVSLNDPVGIVDPAHYVNRAKRMAEMHTRLGRDPSEEGTSTDDANEENDIATGGLTHNSMATAESLLVDDDTPKLKHNASRGFFADQFENHSNYLAHLRGTGPEIYAQTGGNLDAFVAGAGTGGTISGVALFMKPRLPECRIVLADPQGSGLYNKVKFGVMFADTEREGTRRRHQVDSMVEGIGCNRVTANFDVAYDKGLVDDAIKVTDAQATRMARWLVQRDGIFVGSSSAVNVVAAVITAKKLMGENNEQDTDIGVIEQRKRERKTVVTILCDSGMRHLSRFWAQTGEVGGQSEDDMTLDDVLAIG